jgi:hypothetical protein
LQVTALPTPSQADPTSWLGRAGAARSPLPPRSLAFQASPPQASGATTTTHSSRAPRLGPPSQPATHARLASLVGQQPSAAAASARAQPGPTPATDALPDRSTNHFRSVASSAVEGAARARSRPHGTRSTPAVKAPVGAACSKTTPG